MFKSGFITIMGRPNVGKSTLLNALLGEKIAAVSSKPQTTRTQITGVLTTDACQYVFVDTPGIHTPKNKLGKFMMRQVASGSGGADVVLYMVDAAHCRVESELELLAGVSAPCVMLLLNKTDTVSKEALLPLIAAFSSRRQFAEIVPISALKRDGLDGLLKLIAAHLPEGPKFFPDDMLTDQPERQIAAELIREKLMRNLNDEIPFGIAVVVEKMQYNEEKALTSVSATVYCERESHKAIIIGKKGAMLKKVGAAARHELERFTGTRVFLELWVKVQDNWRNSDMQLKNFGYDAKN